MVALHDRVEHEQHWLARKADPSIQVRYPGVPYPEEQYIPRQMVRDIILIVRPALFLSLFSKDNRSVMTVCASLNHIAWLEPDLILPGVLEKVYPSLEMHSEAHRLISCLSALGAVSLPLIHRKNYPAGATHLVPLLELTLPALDMNDPMKTSLTFLFYMKMFACVPLFEVPPGNGGSPLKRKRAGETAEFDDDNDFDIPGRDAIALDQYDEVARDSSRSLESFVSSFMTKIMTLIENLPALSEDGSSNSSTVEGSIANLIPLTCEIFFAQLSPSLFQVAFNKVIQLARLSKAIHVIRTVSCLVGVACTASPAKCAAALVPLCVENINLELEHGAGASPTTSRQTTTGTGEHSVGISGDNILVWYLTLLADVIRGSGGDEIMKWKVEIFGVVNNVWKRCRSYEPLKRASKIARAFITTTSRIYIVENRSVGVRYWNDPDFQRTHWKWWGVPIVEDGPWNDLQDFEIQYVMDIEWHCPKDAEKNAALECFKTYIEPEMESIVALMERAKHDESYRIGIDSTSAFVKSLTMLLNMVRSASMFAGDSIPADGAAVVGDIPGGDFADSKDEELDDDSVMDDDAEVTAEGVVAAEPWGNDDGSNYYPRKNPIGAGYCFTDVNDERYLYIIQMRKKLGTLIHELIHFFLEYRDDDTESMNMIIKVGEWLRAISFIEHVIA